MAPNERRLTDMALQVGSFTTWIQHSAYFVLDLAATFRAAIVRCSTDVVFARGAPVWHGKRFRQNADTVQNMKEKKKKSREAENNNCDEPGPWRAYVSQAHIAHRHVHSQFPYLAQRFARVHARLAITAQRFISTSYPSCSK